MNVSNLPVKERLRLFNEWISKENERDEIFDEGNNIDLTKEQMADREYIIPEWNCTPPEFCFDENLSEKIGCYVKCPDGSIGEFLCLSCSYVDFYYKIKVNDTIEYYTCVGKIEFI